MAAKLKSDPHLAIGHVLFMDVVGYSKLLVNEQREVVQQLNQVVRKTAQFRKSDCAGKTYFDSFRRWDGVGLFRKSGRTGAMRAGDQPGFKKPSASSAAHGRAQRARRSGQGC